MLPCWNGRQGKSTILQSADLPPVYCYVCCDDIWRLYNVEHFIAKKNKCLPVLVPTDSEESGRTSRHWHFVHMQRLSHMPRPRRLRRKNAASFTNLSTVPITGEISHSPLTLERSRVVRDRASRRIASKGPNREGHVHLAGRRILGGLIRKEQEQGGEMVAVGICGGRSNEARSSIG